MAVSQINISRVSHNMQTYAMLDSLRSNTLNLFMEQSRLSSGNKFNTLSENPIGGTKALQLSEILEQQEQILTNIRHADSFLAASDSAIGEINELLIQAHSIASEMVNVDADQAQRDSMAELVKGIIDQLVTVGNRSYAGVHLFGGQQTISTPFTQDSGGVEYRGDTGSLTSHVGVGQDPSVNLNGAELFGALAGKVSGYADLNPALITDTRLVDLDGVAGSGVSKGLVRIALSSPAITFTVDLSQADTAGDVIDVLNQAASDAGLTTGVGNNFNASINAASNGFQLVVGAGQVTVTEVGDGVTARDVGLLGTAAGTLNGNDLDPHLTAMTTIASLFGGAGAILRSISIVNGSKSKTIDLSSASTVQNILNSLNIAEVEVKAEINDAATGIDVTNLMSGFEMQIGEAGGNTAQLLGIRSLHGQTKLSELNHGDGVRILEGKTDIRVVAKDGTNIDVNLDGSTTIQDVIDKINAAATAAGVAVTASLATTGNGIRIVDTTGALGVMRIERLNYSAAIDDLGLNKVAPDDSVSELISDDTAGVRVDSVFTALVDLLATLRQGDVPGITDAGERINGFIDQASRMQGLVGARSKAMGTRLELTEDATLATQILLSEVRDLDYTEAVTRFQQAQTILQANLMTGARILQLSLLDFLR